MQILLYCTDAHNSLIENRACSWIDSGPGMDALHSDRPSNPSAYQDHPQVQPTGTSTCTRARRPKGEAIQTTLVFSFALAGMASSNGQWPASQQAHPSRDAHRREWILVARWPLGDGQITLKLHLLSPSRPNRRCHPFRARPLMQALRCAGRGQRSIRPGIN